VFAGALGGIAGVLVGMRQPIKQASTIAQQQHLRRLRSRGVAWVVFAAILLALAYEFTAGAWAPIAAYGIFCVGLSRWCYRIWSYTMLNEHGQFKISKSLICGFSGLILGCGTGLAGLIVGLINSGRL